MANEETIFTDEIKPFDFDLFFNIITRKEEKDGIIVEIREAKKEEVNPEQYAAYSQAGKFLLVMITDTRDKTKETYESFMSATFIPNKVDAGQENLPNKEKEMAKMIVTGVENKVKEIKGELEK